MVVGCDEGPVGLSFLDDCPHAAGRGPAQRRVITHVVSYSFCHAVAVLVLVVGSAIACTNPFARALPLAVPP